MNKTRVCALLMTLMLILSALPGPLALAGAAASGGTQLAASKAVSASTLASKKKKKKKAAKATPSADAVVALESATVPEPTPAPEPTAKPEPAAKPEPTAAPEPTQAPKQDASDGGDGESATEGPGETQDPEQDADQDPDQTAEPTEADAEATAKAAVSGKAPLVVEFRAKVNGVRTEIVVADPVTVNKNGKVDLNRVNLLPSVPLDGKEYYLNPARWEPESSEGVNKITKDKVVYALYDSARTANSSLTFSGRQGDTITISLPIAYLKDEGGGSTMMSNTSDEGGQIDAYGESTLPASFDQSFASESGLTEMYAQVQTKNVPFTSGSISKANGDRVNASVVLGYNELPESMRAGLTVGAPVNKGLAVFALTIANGANVKTHSVPFDLFWTDASGKHQTVVYVKVKVSKKASSSSSGGGGGGTTSSGSAKPNPVPRVYIDDVTTDPENPKAGDKFLLIMNVINTSKTSYLQNMQLSWSASDDSLMPQGMKTNVEYIERIPADSSHRLEIPVEALAELPSKLVKVDISMDYEDKKVNAQQESQTLTVQVQPQQRIKIDDPKMPTDGALVGESYEFELPITNTGKVMLYNLEAVIVSDNEDLIIGSPANGGNIEVGGSKSLTLECTPDAEGQFEATIEISYESESGDVSKEEKKFSFTATEEDDSMDYWDDDPFEFQTPTPETPTALTVMKLLPPWLFAGVGALVLLLIVSMSVSARKRRRRAMEDDEVE